MRVRRQLPIVAEELDYGELGRINLMVRNCLGSGVDLCGLFFQEAKRYPLLTPEEEISLGKIIWDADDDFHAGKFNPKKHQEALRARERMILGNLRLVFSILQKYSGRCRSVKEADLLQVGMIGLMRAVLLFDYRRGFRFCTFASWHIRAAMSLIIKTENTPVHLPSNAGKRGGFARVSYEEESLEAMPDESGGACPDEGVRREDQRRMLEKIIAEAKLSAIEIDIIKSRTADDEETLQVIGDRYGVSRERIRQLEERALEKLRGAVLRLGCRREDLF